MQTLNNANKALNTRTKVGRKEENVVNIQYLLYTRPCTRHFT